MKKFSGKKIAVIVTLSIVALILAALITVYAIYRYYYGKMHVEDADTSVRDLEQLANILEADLDADVSGFPEKDVDSVRSGIVFELIETLPRIDDYTPLIDAVKADFNADLSAFLGELTKEELAIVRWGVHYGYDYLISDMKKDDDSDSVSDEETTLPHDKWDTTTPPETTVPPEVTTPSDTTTSPDVTTPSDTTTSPDVTTPDDTSKRPEGTTVVTDTEPTPGTSDRPITDEDIYNVLIIGCDAKNSTTFTGLSDTIIVASVNRVTKRIVLTSIMRDTVVKDPETKKYAKINSFYARSGSVGERAGRLMNALKYNFDIEIENYVVVNMNAFKEIVDIFGGVEVPLYYSEYLDLCKWFADTEYDMGDLDGLYTDKKNGYINVSLNSRQALWYARMRSNLWNPESGKWQRSDDSYRTERQRFVIKSIVTKARSMTFSQLIDIANKVLPLVATDLTADEFLVKITQYTDFASYSVDMMNLTYTKLAWYPCKFSGNTLIFQGDPGYAELNGKTGVGILEAPYRDGYKLMKEAWRLKVYQ